MEKDTREGLAGCLGVLLYWGAIWGACCLVGWIFGCEPGKVFGAGFLIVVGIWVVSKVIKSTMEEMDKHMRR